MVAFTSSQPGGLELEFLIASPTNSDVVVTIETSPSAPVQISESFSVRAGSSMRYTVPSSLQVQGTGISTTGLFLRATDQVVVHGLNRDSSTCGGFMLIPLESLGYNYYTMSWSSPTRPGQLAIVATADGPTTVTVTLPRASSVRVQYDRIYGAGEQLQVVLNRFQVFHVEDTGFGDMTGTMIASNNVVAVFSGNKGGGLAGADHSQEQMPPVPTFGRTYVALPSPGGSGQDTVKVIATRQNTVVRLAGLPDIQLANVGDSQSIPLTSYMSFTSDQSIFAVQFLRNEIDGSNDSPSAIILTPQEQFQTGYSFAGPSQGFNSYIMIATESNAVQSLILDGQRLDTANWQNIPGTTLVGTVRTMEERQEHYIYSEGGQPLSAAVYYVSPGVCSFGYAAGMCLADIRQVCVYSVPGTKTNHILVS